LVPDGVKDDGKLVFAVDASYPPNEYTDSEGTITGWGVDLATQISDLVGLEPQFVNVSMNRLISDVSKGDYELGLASISITPARTPLVDLVSYARAGTAWAVASGNPTGMTQNAACGRRVAVLKGSVQADDITTRSILCAKANRSGIVIEPFQKQTDATTALLDGSVDATLADSPVVTAAVAANGTKLQELGTTYGVLPYGIAVPKGSGDLAIAVRRAVQKLIDDGSYAQIMSKAGVADAAIQTSLIYPPAR
jgi:polar amino acid transport system substrate-binding protein